MANSSSSLPQTSKELLAPVQSGCQPLSPVLEPSLRNHCSFASNVGSWQRTAHWPSQLHRRRHPRQRARQNCHRLQPRSSSHDFQRSIWIATELVKTGSRIHERYRLKAPGCHQSLEQWLGELRGRLSQRRCSGQLLP